MRRLLKSVEESHARLDERIACACWDAREVSEPRLLLEGKAYEMQWVCSASYKAQDEICLK